MESISHNVEKADDNIIVTSVSDDRKHVQYGETMDILADTYRLVGEMRAKTCMMKH